MKAIIRLAQNVLFCAADDHKESHSELVKLNTAVESNLQLQSQRLDQHKERLDKQEEKLDNGSKEFKEIRKAMASLDKSYALLAQKAKDRRESDRKEDDDGG